jgi:hypothetical protein
VALTRVSPSLFATSNNITSVTVGGSANTISLTFDGSGVITSATNNAISVANTLITGNIISSQITSVANTQLTGTITGSQISSNTLSNTVFQTGSVENYMNAAGLGFGMRNRIINGAMVIDQRNAGASVTPTNFQYTLDRWAFEVRQTSKLTTQQSTTVPSSGFKNSLLITSSSAYSVISTDRFNLQQYIEGYNIADLNWGSASASTVTISFWIRSSLTGTFAGSVQNGSQNRSYIFNYTINSANTFEYKTVTIAGDQSGTWSTDNSAGLILNFALGTGSTYQGTASTWTGSNVQSTSGAVSLVGTNGATFYITGVQLEKGSTATSFDYRSYGTEYDLCRRYFEQWNFSNTGSATVNQYIGLGQGYSSTDGRTVLNYYPKRAQPSCAVNGGGLRFSTSGGGATGTSGWTFDQPGPIAVLLYNSSLTGITQGYSYHVVGTAAGNITFNAEL